MLKVPSVQTTVDYWIEKGGKVVRSSEKEDGTLQSAFVALGGHGGMTDQSFALELVEAKNPFDLGNCISYIGVSLLLQFQSNLIGAAAGEKPKEEGEEPNSIRVNSAAAAPGDYFARFCLKSNDLVATNEFYTDVMGMEIVAIDENEVCLRYENGATKQTTGVPTTLVFEKTSEELRRGTCFDHIVISSKADMETECARIQDNGGIICMKPTAMFGQKIFGVKDPNGYKVIVAGK